MLRVQRSGSNIPVGAGGRAMYTLWTHYGHIFLATLPLPQDGEASYGADLLMEVWRYPAGAGRPKSSHAALPPGAAATPVSETPPLSET